MRFQRAKSHKFPVFFPVSKGDVVFAPHFVVFAHLHAASLGFKCRNPNCSYNPRIDETIWDSNAFYRGLDNADARNT